MTLKQCIEKTNQKRKESTTTPWMDLRVERIESIHWFIILSTFILKRIDDKVKGTISSIPNTYISKSFSPSFLIHNFISSSTNCPLTFHVPAQIRNEEGFEYSLSLIFILLTKIYFVVNFESITVERMRDLSCEWEYGLELYLFNKERISISDYWVWSDNENRTRLIRIIHL